jgi:F-type H+-transporting ATPase subunit b
MIDFDKTIIYQFLNFIVLLILLNFLLFKPVLKALSKREETLKSLGEGSDEAKGAAKDFDKRYDDVTREKKRPILESKDAIITEAHNNAVKVIEKARNELSADLARIKSEIKVEGERVYASLRTDVDRLSSEVAQKILKRSPQ